MTADEMATHLVEIVMTNDNCPPEFCADVRRFCDEIVFAEFKLEFLKRSLLDEEI